MRKTDSFKNLDLTRSLVMGNMPRTIVHTARQPLPEALKDAVKALTGGEPPFSDEPGSTAERAARAFMSASSVGWGLSYLA